MNPKKRLFDSTDLLLSTPGTSQRRNFLASVWSSPFLEHSAYTVHHSCVNALAISRGEGRWLASGGDDKRVILNEALANDDEGTLGEPRASYTGAQSNIFAIDFDSDCRKVYSTGNDAVILCHDLETSAESTSSQSRGPSDIWIDNDDSVHGLACHPTNPCLFLSASSDGTLRQYDSRSDTNAVGILADAHEMEGVAYHPLHHDLFAYSGEDAHAGLVDSRMAWTDTSSTRVANIPRPRIAREVAVVNWQVNLVRKAVAPRTRRARPAASSVTFSPLGDLVTLTLSGHLPTLYTLSSPAPLANFAAPARPLDAAETASHFPETYRNASTTKHGSFGGGPGARDGQGLFYAAGSDDFGVYIWEVPRREALEKGGTTASFATGEWPSNAAGTGYLAPSRAGEPASLTFPQSINTPTSVLRTHRSIPNTTLYHPSLPYLYTCGVEKVIVRHSPATSSSSRLRSRSKWSFTPRIPRAEPASFLSSLFGAADPGEEPELLPGETEEARETRLRQEETAVLEYFDELIISESDFEGVWRDAKEGEVDGIVDEESSDDSDEGFGLDDEEDEERFEGAGESGTTRRILNSIAQAGEEDEGEGTSDTEGSQGSLTLSEQAEYQSLMDAWNERAGQGGSEDEAS
ncbi:hypothetical protein JCM3766R1_004481 [Sporobolomyces carnicolor]